MIPMNENLDKLRRSPIRLFTNLANETPGCIKLTIGEPDMDTPLSIREAAVEAIMAGKTHYAPNQGVKSLRAAVAEFETRRGNTVTEDQVLITVGATQALHTALFGILNPGEEVIVLSPNFVLYDSIVAAAGGVLRRLDISQSDFQVRQEALLALLSEKTKAIILNSPNNPTGTVLSAESLSVIKRAVLGKPIFLICDNVYQALCDEDCPDLSRDAGLKEQILLCQSFSKPWAMTGWRIGYIAGPKDVMDKLLLLSAATIASSPTFLQDAAIEALRTDPAPMAAVFRRRQKYAADRLRAMGLAFPEPKGAFYVFPDIRRFGMTSHDFCVKLIREAKVAAVPGSCFGCEGFIRISCCCSDEALEEGLNRLEKFLEALASAG